MPYKIRSELKRARAAIRECGGKPRTGADRTGLRLARGCYRTVYALAIRPRPDA
jgi:hypothetical protein